MSLAVSGHFLGELGRRIFVLLRRPAEDADRGCVLVVPPFAEEMNKSRGMVTTVAVQLVARGCAVVVPDLFGTGDSEGDLTAATVERWRRDLAETARFCEHQGVPVKAILGIRLGCALAGLAVKTGDLPSVQRTVFWQPIFDGERYLRQFLRLRVASTMMTDDHKETVQDLRQRLDAGECLEVVGYPLPGELVRGLDALKTGGLSRQLGSINWFEVVREAGGGLPVASARQVSQARASGLDIQARAFTGEAFWTSVEIVRIPDLVAATVDALA